MTGKTKVLEVNFNPEIVDRRPPSRPRRTVGGNGARGERESVSPVGISIRNS